MNEKIYEFHLDHALSAAKRRLVDDYIEEHAPRFPWEIQHYWEEEAKVLHVKTNVVKWELVFQGRKLEVFGTGPFWARMMFTDKLREQLRLGLLKVLQEVELLDNGGRPAAKKAKHPRKKTDKADK